MNIETIIKLLDAGYTKDEIMNMNSSSQDPEPGKKEPEKKEPEKAYKGCFNVRISPELHKQAVICATAHQMTLNSLVERAMKNFIGMIL